MLHFHGRAHDGLLSQAIAAAVLSLIGHTLAKVLRNVGGGHLLATSPEMSWPRS